MRLRFAFSQTKGRTFPWLRQQRLWRGPERKFHTGTESPRQDRRALHLISDLNADYSSLPHCICFRKEEEKKLLLLKMMMIMMIDDEDGESRACHSSTRERVHMLHEELFENLNQNHPLLAAIQRGATALKSQDTLFSLRAEPQTSEHRP
ncbi:hypothetical protein L6164_011506 [Bauhinia variegata]|uniref:Uncharacterized protein n=1 Tax=Bauhinia variegata TaxID=167791 RepID=A0ACB9P8R1_BAUVA|nr:hypothetical protein L6164_011506 [Bauhinia variegata]